MKHDSIVRRPSGLLAGLVLVAAATAASAVTPQEILEHSQKVLADKKAEVAGGKKELAKEARNLETAITNFTAWVDAVDKRGSWIPNEIAVVAAGINPDDIVTMSDMGIEIPPDDEDRVLYGFREEAGRYVCFPSDPPEAYRFFVIGRAVSSDVVSALDGEGMFSSITRKDYLERRGRIKIANQVDAVDPDDEINMAEWNNLLVGYAKRIGLPMPPEKTVPPWVTPVAIAAGVLALLAIVILLARRKGGSSAAVPAAVPPDGAVPYDDAPVDGGLPVAPAVPAVPAEPAVPAAPAEFCPVCKNQLVDGACPQGHTLVRCDQCGTLMVNGKCPNGCVEPEICPTCHSELVDGCCPKNHTIIRCADCGSILVEGVCPNGCNADPLNLGWPGSAKPEMSPFALEVSAPSEYAGARCNLPVQTVIGRSYKEAREPFIELLIKDPRAKNSCSRRYVQLEYKKEKDLVLVTLLKTSGNVAWVGGEKLAREGESGELREGGLLKLNPGYELKLVRAS